MLLLLPGEASSVVTVFDGFALAKQGKPANRVGYCGPSDPVVGATISIIGPTPSWPPWWPRSRSTSARPSARHWPCSVCSWSRPSAAATSSRR
ncbi:MAG: hypothetical protein U5N53_14005 [Mycobacterium sp.]|nr:hypothetical protein [Mycobacterium sp.]